MPKIPAICEQCQAVYPSMIDVRSRDATIVACSQTCPKCGGMGRLLDGVYTALEDVLHVLPLNTDLLKRIVSVLEEGKERQKSRDQIRADMEEVSPKFGRFTGSLKETDLYAILKLIIPVLTLLILHCDNETKPTPQPTTQVIKEVIDMSVTNIYLEECGEQSSHQGANAD